jgi:uncharacterized protein
MIIRAIEKHINNNLLKGKAIMLFGARQTGKTTLLENLIQKVNMPTLWLNADEADIREVLYNTTSTKLRTYFGQNKLIIIDEAQRIKNVGITIKLITDRIKDIQVIATGSSALELANEINEPLTGRKYEFRLHPLSFSEMVSHHGLIEETRMLENRLIYGYYPEVVLTSEPKNKILNLIADSYLYKDLFTHEKIKKPLILEKLLKSLALQIGQEVSYNELSQQIGIDKQTVEKYIDLLEKTYVIFKLPAYNKNVRNELRKSKKIYFFDNGIRNAVIGNYNNLGTRTDIGPLWENFLISERIKHLNNTETTIQGIYFWRTTQQQEVDYIEETNSKLAAWEFKWSSSKKAKISKTFMDAYPGTAFQKIDKDNYLSFIGIE